MSIFSVRVTQDVAVNRDHPPSFVGRVSKKVPGGFFKTGLKPLAAKRGLAKP